MKKIHKFMQLAGGVTALISLSACSNNGVGSGGKIANSATDAAIGQMSVIPLTDNSNTTGNISSKRMFKSSTGSYKLAITNNKSVAMIIDSISVSGSNASADNVGNGSCGNIVQGNNTCYLDIKPLVSAGSFFVNVSFHYEGSKDTRQLKTLISASPVASNDGFSYGSTSSRIVTQKGQTRMLSIPIILSENYASLKTTSNSSSFIECGGNSYTRGTACTLIVAVKGGSSNSITTASLIGTLANGQQKSMSLNTIVSINPEPNLLVGGTGLIINPANGQSANQVEIEVMNAGTASATSLAITPTSPLTVTTSGAVEPCGNTLAADASCSFFVNAESNISGQNTVTISDAEGDSQLVNVFYVAESASPALSIVSSGSLENTIAGYESQSITFTITNNSTADTTFTNLLLSNVAIQNSYMSYIAYTGGGVACFNSANPSGINSLAPGDSCNVTVSYNPLAGVNSQSGNIIFNPVANYVDANNVTKTYSQASYSSNYSSTAPVISIVLTTPANNSQSTPFPFHISPNGVESQGQIFSFTNTGNVPANTITFNQVLPGYPSLNSVNVMASASLTNPCVNLGTLNPGATCNVILTYGPVATAQNLESVGLEFAAVNPVTSNVTGLSYYISAEATDTKLTLAAIEYSLDGTNWTTIESTADLGGAVTNPLTFTNYQAYPVYIRYTYFDDGSESALSFNVNLNNIPAQYGVVANQTTCAYGANAAILDLGSSCQVVVKTVDYSKSAIYSNGAGYISGALNINVPAISYTSPNTGVHKNVVLTYAPTADTMTYITANRFFTNAWSISVSGGESLPWSLVIRPSSYTLAANESNPTVNLNIASWGSAFQSYSTLPVGLVINPDNWNIPLMGTSESLNFVVPNYMPAAAYVFPYTVTSGHDSTTNFKSTLGFTLN